MWSAAGKGTRYHPTYHQSTPDTVWDILDNYMKIKDRNSINPKMFNSFVDGTKSGIEMTAVCNATGLESQSEGLSFPPATRFEHAEICKPKVPMAACWSASRRDGGHLLGLSRRDRRAAFSLVMGTYVVFESDSAYSGRVLPGIFHAARQERQIFLPLPADPHDRSGARLSRWPPPRCASEATGAPICFNSDVVATAKRDLKAGEILDGEGGFCVWGKQTPAKTSLAQGYLPLGLAHRVKLKHDIARASA